jgi:hypothetical protein
MKTTIHTYRFDIRNTEENAAYQGLVETLKSTRGRGHWMESHGGASYYLPNVNGAPAILDTLHFFENQWNAEINGKSIRVFDWAQDYKPNGSPFIKRGHYLDISAEMVEIRQNTMVCGYCGKHEPAQKGYVFCPHCIDSEYLTEDMLHLTRMVPVCESRNPRAPLSEAERANLIPLFVQAQTHGTTVRGKARIEKMRADSLSKRDKAIKNANTEYDGFKWLTDRGINTANCIYYSHTMRFCFGWRESITGDVRTAILDVLRKFPFDYDVK